MTHRATTRSSLHGSPLRAAVLLLGIALATAPGAVAATPPTGGASRRAAALPPHAEHHPRLLFDAAGAPALHAAIQADDRRRDVWETGRALAVTLAAYPPEVLLQSYYGHSYMEELSLLACLDPSSDADTWARAVIDALLWQTATYDTETDPFLSVLAPTLRLHNLAWGWDMACQAATEAEREALADEMLRYLDVLATDYTFTRYQQNPYVSNKGISLGAALMLGVLALEPDLPGTQEIPRARDAARAYLDKGLGDMLTPGGCYREGLGYFVWAMRTLMPTWRAMGRLVGAPPLADEELGAILEATAFQIMDEGGGLFLNRNDHNSRDFIVGRHHSLLEFATAFGPEPDLARWLLRRSSGDLGHPLGFLNDPVATLLWHTAGVERAPDLPATGRFFSEAGFWVYRRSWPGDDLSDCFLITLEGGQFRGGHAQEDVGQVILRAFGHGFALDHGAGDVAKQTEAHNLPLIDGRGQHNAGASIGTDGKLRRLLAGPRWAVLRADMTRAYTTHSPFNDPDYPEPGTDWSWGYDGGNPMRAARRTLLLLPGGPGEIPEVWLRDRLESEQGLSRRMEWRQHLDEDLAILSAGSGVWRAAGAGGALRMQLHAPDPALVAVAVTPFDNGNVDDDGQVFAASMDAAAVDFLWQWTPLRPGDAEPVVTSEPGAGGVRVISLRGGRERKVLVRSGEEAFAAGADTLAGEWGLVEREGGALRHLLVDGTRLVEAGILLADLADRGSASWEGDTVRLSARGRRFRVRAPGAVAVLAGSARVPFAREGDYVVGPLADFPPQPVAALRLLPPWPNPGPAPLHFSLALPAAGRVILDIFDVRGRRLRRLEAVLPVEAPELSWDGRDTAGRRMPSGVYLARAAAGGETAGRRFVLLRE
ncbi:MAG: hypothetical protein JW819_04645 [Candidatus Krumholzibacteriota bacterium]|nr:hypothetical protein [Candidatus Krumholzibacteriota bacterium]